MINLTVKPDISESVDPIVLEETAKNVLEHCSASSNTDLTIAIEDNGVLHSLNLRFLGIDAPTDVLSFPANETDPETGNLYLGDIAISIDCAKQQASNAGHSLENELRLLVIHGVLHLLGYDHSTSPEKEQMWSIQSELLQKLKIKINKYPED